MISTSWIEKRKPYWQKLETLVAAGSPGVKKLGHDELGIHQATHSERQRDVARVPGNRHFLVG